MDALARAPASERAAIFEETAARRNVTGPIIEKDFWVCWTLRRLFALQDPTVGFIFKGGTSLSKAYGLIGRFSEDVDLSLDRHDLGFCEGRDPAAKDISGKHRKALLKELEEATAAYVGEPLLDRLRGAFAGGLGSDAFGLDVDDRDPQTLLFRFPAGLATASYGGGYLGPSVKLEFGSRSDHLPAEDRVIVPYAAETFPEVVANAQTTVRVLAAERTFWEKATILHQLAHRPPEKALSDRTSRHYADLVALARSDLRARALARPDLLAAVAEHKSRLFRDPKARYEEARHGTLVLTPPAPLRRLLASDYRAMREMFFEEPITFETIMNELVDLEAEINAPQVR
ncbi:MAG: hypothetical protein CMJ75_14175 [Planctomycetaceae bacterium]|nr:hypothetical protein [Planctomycetaceae bacterium]